MLHLVSLSRCHTCTNCVSVYLHVGRRENKVKYVMSIYDVPGSIEAI